MPFTLETYPNLIPAIWAHVLEAEHPYLADELRPVPRPIVTTAIHHVGACLSGAPDTPVERLERLASDLRVRC